MAQGNVYVVQEPPPIWNRQTGKSVLKDLSSAQRYGRLMTVLGSSDQPSLTPGPCLFQLQKGLREFNPSDDYICFAGGDPMSLALALLVIRDFGIKEVKTLRWDRERTTSGERKTGGFYTPISTPLRP